MTPSHFPRTFVAALACMLFFSTRAFAVAPAVIMDSQQTWLSTLNQPQSLVTAKNGTIYVADSGNGRVLAVVHGTSTVVSTPGFTLGYPDAVAVDATGDLFIADENSATVIEVPVSGSPSLVAGPPTLAFPSALAVDSTGNLYIGDAQNGAVYELPAGGGALTQITLTGISSVIPTAMTTDAANNLYIADDNANSIYKVPPGGGTASNVTPAGFTLNQPSGLAFDSLGNLYVLDTYNERIVEVPAADATHPYQVPISGLVNPSGLTTGLGGNLYVADYSNNNVTEVLYNGTPVDLGQETTGTQATSQVDIAVEINQPTNLSGGGSLVVNGDSSNDATAGSDTNCQFVNYSDNPVGSGNPITPQNPFVCVISAVASPAYPGLRAMTFQLYDDTGTLLASIPLNDTGLTPDALFSPMASSVALSNFYAPWGIAVSGDNHTVYIADSGTDDPGTSNVYGWYAAENNEYTVNTGAFPLSFASGVAVNRNGDLYIADFELAEVIVVPASGAYPYKLDTGTLLKTPSALAFNPKGDLIIGDNGPEGFDSSTAQPGFLVEVPHDGGPASLLNTGPVILAEPDAFAFNTAGDLYVADAGPYNPDTQTYSAGQIVLIPHDGSTPSVVDVPGFLPAGISVDPAGDLDVMFAYPASITVVPPNGGSQYSLPFSPNSFTEVSTLTPGNGSQFFLFTDDDDGSLQELNGITVPLSFPATEAGSQSDPLSVTMVNIGNLPLTLASPPFIAEGQSADFPLQGATTCTDSLVVTQAGSCTVSAVFSPGTSGDFSASLLVCCNAFVGNDLLNNYNFPTINLSGSTSGGMGMVMRATPAGVARPLQGHGRKHVRPARPMSVN